MHAPIVRALGENPEPEADDLEGLAALEPAAAELIHREDEKPERRAYGNDRVHRSSPPGIRTSRECR